MRLKRLKIVGFKSFADRVTIDFDAEVIGVVGPNGCGKSNIVDAFRWVMGEQSAKSMRGDKMHDVLFGGTSKRKALNLAEVAVTLTQIAGELATPYEEVTLARRLHRNGESEYLINNQLVRLRDVQDLLLGSGMGKNAFSIFEQGKIERIINLPPVQRRTIFDEAAGIGRFLERKKESVRKLSQVDENYNRIKDIHDEVERQTRTLKKQATLAKQYQTNKERLTALEAAVLITRLKHISARTEKTDLANVLQELEKEQKAFDLTQQRHLVVKKEIGALEAKANYDREALYQANSGAKISAAEFDRQKERLAELTLREKTLQRQLSDVQARQKGFVAGSKEEGLEEKLIKLTIELKQVQQEHLQAIRRQGELKGEVQDLKRLEGVQKENGEKKKNVEQLSKEIDVLKEELSLVIRDLTVVEEELKKVDEREHERKIVDLNARAKALNSLSGAITNQLYKEAEVQERTKLLTSLIQPKRGHAKAIEVALHTYKQTLVAQSQADYDFVIAYAAKKKIKDFSLVCMEGLKGGKKGLFSYVEKGALAEHFLGSTQIEVTDEGDFIDHLGVRHSHSEKGARPFLYKEELEEIAEQLKVLEKELVVLRKAHEKLTAKQNGLKLSRRGVEEKRRKLEMQLVQENFAYQRTLKELSGKDMGIVPKLEQELKEVILLSLATSKRVEILEQERQKLQFAVQEMKVMEAKKQENAAQEKRLLDEYEQVQTTKTLTEKAIQMRHEVAVSQKEKLENLQACADESAHGFEAAKQKREEIETLYIKARDDLKELEKRKHKMELSIAEESALQNELEHELVERHQISLQEALQSEMILDNLQEAEKELKQLRISVEKAGAINMTAIEEYQIQAERFDMLDEQLNDLATSKRDLEQIIIALDAESRKIFKEVFTQIQENFKRNFQTLFNGGEADLKFTESKDILEAGIEIIAKPPGKQMRSISLLSGGEKCLTALALLFSIFEVKPAPFCILDEVDAPLDDSNVDRFTKMLKHYVDKTQFIVVTHNKKTMAVADILIGVSMEEKGVSKLLSLTFERKYADRNTERV